MDTLGSAVLKFSALHHAAKDIERAALEHGAREFLRRAKAAIGTYEYGWTPLADSTLKKKGADTPLLESGEMQESGFYEMQMNGARALIAFADPKIAFHEFGTSRVPPRPVIGGTITHHGQEIAAMMALETGKMVEGILMGRGIAGVISSLLGRRP